MSTETNKAIVRRYYDQVWNERRPDLIDEFLAEDFVIYGTDLAPGLEGVKQFYALSLAAFPDQQLTIEDMIAEGDKVVVRATFTGTHQGELFGIPPTGKQVSQSSAAILRLAKGKIVEDWWHANDLSLMQQLGAIPAPQAG